MKSLIFYKTDIDLNNIILAIGDCRIYYRDAFGVMNTLTIVNPSLLSPFHYIPLNLKEVK